MTQATETQTQAQASESKPRKARDQGAHVQFFMNRGQYARVQACARSEGLTAGAWIRLAAIKASRRKPSV